MSDLPVVEPPFDAPTGEPPDVAGVLLAAGTSDRFGEANKLLEPIDGEALVRRAVDPLIRADLAPVIVVVGHEAAQVRRALADLPVTIVENPDYAAGQAMSVRTGVAALPDGIDAAVFALGDMPWVSVGTIEALVAAYQAGKGTALAAAYRGERGNPVLWAAEHFPALAEQTGDVGGRDLLSSVPEATLVETGDPGTRRDVDRRDDLT